MFLHCGVKAESLDREQRVIHGADGKVDEPYDVLVLATGSRPYVPPLPGTQQQGVFVFRTLDDCAAISAYAQKCARAVVLGGGLLGLEAARGLLSHGLEVTVVESAPHLMVQQLDARQPDATRASALPVPVNLGSEVVGRDAPELTGDSRVAGLQFSQRPFKEVGDVAAAAGQATAATVVSQKARMAGRRGRGLPLDYPGRCCFGRPPHAAPAVKSNANAAS